MILITGTKQAGALQVLPKLIKTNKGVTIMPIIDVSGLTKDEVEEKVAIRAGIKKCFASRFGIPEETVTVTFITDDTTDRHEHVMARMYSRRFIGMNTQDLEEIGYDTVAVLEIAGHPYNEAFPIPIMAMCGRGL